MLCINKVEPTTIIIMRFDAGLVHVLVGGNWRNVWRSGPRVFCSKAAVTTHSSKSKYYWYSVERKPGIARDWFGLKTISVMRVACRFYWLKCSLMSNGLNIFSICLIFKFIDLILSGKRWTKWCLRILIKLSFWRKMLEWSNLFFRK
jgi:hypothetical protein